MELGRESRRGEVMGLMIKYWYQIICMNIDDTIMPCYA
jgi:hypothetical protein